MCLDGNSRCWSCDKKVDTEVGSSPTALFHLRASGKLGLNAVYNVRV
jgi:hypothetical protein